MFLIKMLKKSFPKEKYILIWWAFLCDLVQYKLLCQCYSKFEVLFQIIQSAFQDSYLQKDVPVAKLTPLHILHSVLADEVCVQWYIKESSPDRQQNIPDFIINPIYICRSTLKSCDHYCR